MKKTLIAAFFLVFSFALTGCGKKTVDMNQLSEDQQYHYENSDLGFSVTLPKEFEYYQTQRKKADTYVDLEIFVPTADTKYAQEVPGYAKPLMFRIYEKDAYNKLDGQDESKTAFQKIGEKNKKVYLIKFWDKVPSDWISKWSDGMKDSISKSITIK